MAEAIDRPGQTGTRRAGPGHLLAVAVLGLLVAGIIVVAFRGSWGALRDAALAAHFDRFAANLFAFGVDGLIVIAIIAALLLRHEVGARRYCLSVVAGYTGSSWVLNYLHGLGWFAVDPAIGTRPTPPWPVVFIVASLVIGSIFLGSHLLVFVLRHLFPDATSSERTGETYQDSTAVSLNGQGVPELPPDKLENAKEAYRRSLHPDLKTLSRDTLVVRYGISKRQAGRVQNEVKQELAAEHAQDAAESLP